MLDAKYFQDQVQDLEAALLKRGFDASYIEGLKNLSRSRKDLIGKVEALKAKRNQVSQEVGKLKSQAKNNPEAAKQADELVLSMKGVGDEIKTLDEELKQAEEKLANLTYAIPNIPDQSVPRGKDSESNVEVRKWGTPHAFSFQPKDHVDLGSELKILDLERAAKISGARFSLYMGAGARLERALIQFMLDLHTQEHGYEEVIPPFMVNRKSMTGTGQLPKFEEDLFKTGMVDRELFLIPTSEVPLTNILQDEILERQTLPRYFTAYSPCFRSEAGAHGRDTRGLIRQHQFQKVEMVKITSPESSSDELEKMVANAEKVLQLLELPYRVMLLCSGDMGFSSAKTYDLEVWLPSSSSYREISSCSNCTDFQARRAGIRFRPEPGAKPVLAHTLNGSGLAVGRTFIAILENFQQKDGTILIPKVLHRYLEGAPGFNRQGDQMFLVGRRDG